MMSDFVITRESENTNNELRHWKYIKRVKGKNGKYRYIYDRTELDRYDKNATEKMTVYQHGAAKGTVRNDYKKSNNLLDGHTKNTSTISGFGSTTTSTYNVYTQGKLSRAQAKAEKWIYDKFLKKSSGGSVKNTTKKLDNKFVKRGAAKIKSILSVSKAKKAMTKAIKK